MHVTKHKTARTVFPSRGLPSTLDKLSSFHAASITSAALRGIRFIEAKHLSVWSTNSCHLAVSWILDGPIKSSTQLKHIADGLLQICDTEGKEGSVACGAISLPVQISRP